MIVELQGRIGNQLFQFASGYGVARRRGAGVRFDPWRVPVADRLLPGVIGEHYREPTTAELLRVGGCPDSVPGAPLVRSVALRTARLARRARGASPPSLVVWDDVGRFRPEVFDLDLPVRLVGHLQSERYFADVADEIAAAIRLPPAPPLDAGDGPLVGVAFRRGDYNSLGWALPLAYYDAAMDLVAERVGPSTIVVFGDDTAFVELVAGRLARFGPVVDAVARAPGPLDQLALMARCDHLVIANSSFAWWGAWLGDRRGACGRLVVAPIEYGAGDRLPDRWVTVRGGVEGG